MVPKPPGCCAWVGLIVTIDFDLVLGLLLAARSPERACFGTKCPFLAPKRAHMGPKFKIFANLSYDLSKLLATWGFWD